MTVGVTVLGSTGSIGKHTLDVIDTNTHLYHVEALSACRNIELIFEQNYENTMGRLEATMAK